MKKQNNQTENTNQKLPKYRSADNFFLTSADMETPVGVSETVPDQSYTVKELIEKFTTGTPVNMLKNSVWTENPDFDNFDETERGDFDLADASEQLEEFQIKQQQIKQKQKTSEQTKNQTNRNKTQQNTNPNEGNENKENDITA
ncbi:MAG: hypothetical protein [Microviridae sp.]|nr:MAG: hypothetical protein [Microviridae sp.]